MATSTGGVPLQGFICPKRWSALLAVGCLAGFAVPAGASAAVVPELAATGKAIVGPGDSTGTRVTMECDAEASVPVSHVTITQCNTTDGASAPTVSLPLQAAATAATVKVPSVSFGYLTYVTAEAQTITPVRTITVGPVCRPTTLPGIGFTFGTS